MGKASAESFKPHEVEQMARQQQRMNNPNVSNVFGSTTTSFNDDDQSDITQELSPQMQQIIGSQMDFVEQGPAQMGEFSNPLLASMMQGAANNIQGRWGNSDAPDATNPGGGYASMFPQFSQQQPPTPEPMGPTPNPTPSGGGSLGGGFGNVGRDFNIMPGAEQDPSGGMIPPEKMGMMESGRSQKGNIPMAGLSLGMGQDNPNMDPNHQRAKQTMADRMGMSKNAQSTAGQLGQILQNMKWGDS